MSPLAIAIVLIAGLAACVTVLVVRAKQNEALLEAAWPELPGTVLRYDGVADAHRLAGAVSSAIHCLGMVEGWSPPKVAMALAGWRVLVQPAESWLSSSGVMVSGECQLGWGLVAVGPSLVALAHEFAHVCEERIDGHTHDDHSTWDARGIYRALGPYEAAYLSNSIVLPPA